MSDLISREAVIKSMENNSFMVEVFGTKIKVIDGMMVCCEIADLPTIEAVERNKIIDELVNKAMHEFTVLEHHERYPTVNDCKNILRDVAEQMKGGAE